jgi:hypothetical protein
MLDARLRVPVIATALLAGTLGTAVSSVTEAAAQPVAADYLSAQHGPPSAAQLARLVRAASSASAPLVSDTARPGSKSGLPAPQLSAAMQDAVQIRQAKARTYLASVRVRPARDLGATQQAQIRDYFCGPATVSEMLAQLKVVLPQLAAARALGTSQGGTDWSDASGYPVARVLNAHQTRHSFVAVGLPWTPTARQIKTYEMDLVTDISRGAGAPMAGNAYEVPGGPHLVGHPLGQTIMHWFDIRGYSQSGGITDYEDSVHGASSIGWSAAAPAYSSLSSVTIADILGARGYVW